MKGPALQISHLHLQLVCIYQNATFRLFLSRFPFSNCVKLFHHFRKLSTWINDNHCDLTIQSETGQHSQFLRFYKKNCKLFLYKSFISFLCFSHKSFGNFFYVSSLILSHFDFVFVFKILQTSWLGLEIKPPSAWNRIMTLGRTNVAQAENDCTTEWIFKSTDCSSRFSRVDRSNPTTLNTKLHIVNW